MKNWDFKKFKVSSPDFIFLKKLDVFGWFLTLKNDLKNQYQTLPNFNQLALCQFSKPNKILKSFSDKFELILNPVDGNIITQLTLLSIVWLKKQIKTFWLQLWKRLHDDLNSKPVLSKKNDWPYQLQKWMQQRVGKMHNVIW